MRELKLRKLVTQDGTIHLGDFTRDNDGTGKAELLCGKREKAVLAPPRSPITCKGCEEDLSHLNQE